MEEIRFHFRRKQEKFVKYSVFRIELDENKCYLYSVPLY